MTGTGHNGFEDRNDSLLALAKVVDKLATMTHEVTTNILSSMRELHDALRHLADRVAKLEAQNTYLHRKGC